MKSNNRKIDLFKPVINDNKLSKNFKIIKNEVGYSSAKEILNQVYNSVKDIDNAFVNHFQSEGFESRLWEIYLTATFQEMNFNILRNHVRPDFELSKNNNSIFIEAVSTNPPKDKELQNKIEILKNIKPENFESYITELSAENAFKLNSALRNKLNKEYSNNSWVKGRPLVLAIAPFHHSLIHMLSDSDLTSYLYGIENNFYYDENGQLIIGTFAKEKIINKDKKRPSGFFKMKGSEKISAVIFSNSATISKFNRMGKLKGLGSENVRMERFGNRYDPNPNASSPIPFNYTVGIDGPIETWSEGLGMYHNPNAENPIDENLFPNILHGHFDGVFYANVPEFHPINSQTHNLVIKNKI